MYSLIVESSISSDRALKTSKQLEEVDHLLKQLERSLKKLQKRQKNWLSCRSIPARWPPAGSSCAIAVRHAGPSARARSLVGPAARARRGEGPPCPLWGTEICNFPYKAPPRSQFEPARHQRPLYKKKRPHFRPYHAEGAGRLVSPFLVACCQRPS